jgi:FemAB-related protein (PEP-CTERM system-associated)
MSDVSVTTAGDGDKGRWSEFLTRAEGATIFHDWRWGEVIEAAYGHRPAHLIARRGAAVVGVLPLIDVRSPLLGRSLISTAFTVGGGVVADDCDVARALCDAACDAGRALRANYVELRNNAFSCGEGWTEKTGVYAAFEKRLPSDPAEILGGIPRTRRAEIRKALRLEADGALTIRHDGAVDEFYRIYARSLRDHGTPVMPRRFIDLLADAFAREMEISVVEHDGEPVAALASFRRGDRVMPYYVGAAPAARELRAFDFLYYSVMRRAVETGASVFDFGRSKVGGPHFQTKTYWGFEPRPLTYQVALLRAKSAPNVNPNNPKFALLSKAWRRLPPPVANAMGPVLARNFA